MLAASAQAALPIGAPRTTPRPTACIGSYMSPTHDRSVSQRPFRNGATWSLSRNSKALVALRGRHGNRVEEIRLIDKTRPRNLDWASNVVVVTLDGGGDPECVFRLSRAWWQRHLQFTELKVDAHFSVQRARSNDDRFIVSLHLRQIDTQASRHLVLPQEGLVLNTSDPERWEELGIQLQDMAIAALAGMDVQFDELQTRCLAQYFNNHA